MWAGYTLTPAGQPSFVTCTNGAFGVPRDVRGINTDDATTATATATGWSIVRSAGGNYWRHMVRWPGPGGTYTDGSIAALTCVAGYLRDTGRSTEFVTCTNGAFGAVRDVRGINTDDATTTTAIATGWSIVRSAGGNYWRHMVRWRDLVVPTQMARLLH